MMHYTDRSAWNSIRSQIDWTFKAHEPPGKHPEGAYFTTLPPNTPQLASRLRVSAAKVEYAFWFVDTGDLIPLPGGRGKYVFYSSGDYVVTPDRQIDSGPRDKVSYQ